MGTLRQWRCAWRGARPGKSARRSSQSLNGKHCLRRNGKSEYLESDPEVLIGLVPRNAGIAGVLLGVPLITRKTRGRLTRVCPPGLNIPRYVDTFEEEEVIDVAEVQKEIDALEGELVEVRGEMAGYLKELGFTR